MIDRLLRKKRVRAGTVDVCTRHGEYCVLRNNTKTKSEQSTHILCLTTENRRELPRKLVGWEI